MTNRIEIDPKRASLCLLPRILNELYAHAMESCPEECCGLLVGDFSERFQEVFRCRNEMTRLNQQDPVLYPRDGREAFYMNELDYMRAQEEADARGLQVTAVYHSHVGYDAYFSEMDQEYAGSEGFPFPGVDHFVISVLQQKVAGLGVFARNQESGLFEGRAVEARP